MIRIVVQALLRRGIERGRGNLDERVDLVAPDAIGQRGERLRFILAHRHLRRQEQGLGLRGLGPDGGVALVGGRLQRLIEDTGAVDDHERSGLGVGRVLRESLHADRHRRKERHHQQSHDERLRADEGAELGDRHDQRLVPHARTSTARPPSDIAARDRVMPIISRPPSRSPRRYARRCRAATGARSRSAAPPSLPPAACRRRWGSPDSRTSWSWP